MNDDSEPFLEMGEYHLSHAKARLAVDSAVAPFPSKPSDDGRDMLITLPNGNSEVEESYKDLVATTRRTGVVPRIQAHLDASDPVFGGTFEQSSPNFQVKLRSSYAGWSGSKQCPARACPAERDLMRDILYYREQTCHHSSDHTLGMSSRFFRAYLSACVSILEAFLNRYVWLAKHDGFSSPAFKELTGTTDLRKRTELWLQCFPKVEAPVLFDTAEWSQFNEIRNKRNELVHAFAPISMYGAREMQRYLNYVQRGVGGMLRVFRETRMEPVPGFIKRLETAPRVKYRRIRFRADGRHIVTEHE